MGRNANGLMKSSGDSGELTVGQLGLHPKALKAFGGEKYIGGVGERVQQHPKAALSIFPFTISKCYKQVHKGNICVKTQCRMVQKQ